MILRSRTGRKWWHDLDTGRVTELPARDDPRKPLLPNPKAKGDTKTREIFE